MAETMIAETDGGMIEVVTQIDDNGDYITIPKGCYPPKFMNEYALDNWKTKTFKFYDKYKIVKQEHLRV